MIEIRYLNNRTLIQHYSDSGMMLKQDQTGQLYEDPIDVLPCPFTYTETDVPITKEEEKEMKE